MDAATRHLAEGTARHRADSRARACATWPRSPSRAAASTPRSRTQAEAADRAQALLAGAAGPGRRRSCRRRCDLYRYRRPPRADLPLATASDPARERQADRTLLTLRQRYNDAVQSLTTEALKLLREWPQRLKSITDEVTEYEVRGKAIKRRELPRVAQPPEDPEDRRAHLQELGRAADLPAEGKPAGQLPLHRRRVSVPPHRRRPDPHVRRRRHAGAHQPPLPLPVSVGQPAARLSTAFDCVTLYGEDPAPRPDIYGKIGNSGVNIATLDDMKKLYSGFDLCAPTTSVSMTINGPAPMILAMFMNTAIDQQVEKYLRADPHALGRSARRRSRSSSKAASARTTPACCPQTNDGLGLGLLGVTGDQVVDADTYARIKAETLEPRARHRAGRHPQGRPGAEHLHLQHRIRAAHDGRHPAVLRRQQGAQLLFGVDLRLPHRRSRREPDLASSPSP